MWVELYMTHDTGSRSTLDKDSLVSTLGGKRSKRWSLTECLRNMAHTSAANRQDNKCQIKEQRETVLKISVHCHCDILALSRTDLSQLLGFHHDIVEPSPIAWDQFRSTACRSACMEDEREIRRGIVCPEWR